MIRWILHEIFHYIWNRWPDTATLENKSHKEQFLIGTADSFVVLHFWHNRSIPFCSIKVFSLPIRHWNKLTRSPLCLSKFTCYFVQYLPAEVHHSVHQFSRSEVFWSIIWAENHFKNFTSHFRYVIAFALSSLCFVSLSLPRIKYCSHKSVFLYSAVNSQKWKMITFAQIFFKVYSPKDNQLQRHSLDFLRVLQKLKLETFT